jgi:hypothetical protein
MRHLLLQAEAKRCNLAGNFLLMELEALKSEAMKVSEENKQEAEEVRLYWV